MNFIAAEGQGARGFLYRKSSSWRASCLLRVMPDMSALYENVEILPLAVVLYMNRARPEGATLSTLQKWTFTMRIKTYALKIQD
jgi:hypothetical protein